MTANEWNRAHPVGTSVVYTPIKGEPEVKHSTTRSKAWTLGHGAVIVKIEGITGGVSIDHLEPEPGLGEPRVFGVKDGQALVRFPNGETTVIPEIDVSGPVPKVVTWKSMHAIDGSWVACSTREGAEAHQELFLPDARGGVEQVSCPAGTSWSREGGLVGPDGQSWDDLQRGKALVP